MAKTLKSLTRNEIADMSRRDLTDALNAWTGHYTGDAGTVDLDTLRDRLYQAAGHGPDGVIDADLELAD
jgi:hypothetical protein